MAEKADLKLPRYRQEKRRARVGMDLAAQMLAAHRAQPQDGDDGDLIDYLLAAAQENPDLLSEPELLIGTLGPYLRRPRHRRRHDVVLDLCGAQAP